MNAEKKTSEGLTSNIVGSRRMPSNTHLGWSPSEPTGEEKRREGLGGGAIRREINRHWTGVGLLVDERLPDLALHCVDIDHVCVRHFGVFWFVTGSVHACGRLGRCCSSSTLPAGAAAYSRQAGTAAVQ